MMMSEYMSIKSQQHMEEEFRRELERRRVMKERQAEQAEVNKLERFLSAEARHSGRPGPTIRRRLVSALFQRRVAECDPAHR